MAAACHLLLILISPTKTLSYAITEATETDEGTSRNILLLFKAILMTASQHLHGYYPLTVLSDTRYIHPVFLPLEDVIMYIHCKLGGHDTPPNLPDLTL